MGTHPKSPSTLINPQDAASKQPLSEHLGGALPYLFKVLSVASALSIQAHPNKALAEKLHAERPEVYKDDNHKPEMAVALTVFEAMCGFRPAREIAFFLRNVAELAQVVGADATEAFLAQPDDAQTLKGVFTAVMMADKDAVAQAIEALVRRLRKEDMAPFDWLAQAQDAWAALDVKALVLRLYGAYGADVGLLAVFLLNAFRLQPGEALYLGANVPHAYLAGDCLECMACSDNVVRAGLTYKLRDAKVLCEMLRYAAERPQVLKGEVLGGCEYTRQYRGGCLEFRLDATSVPGKGQKEGVQVGGQSEYASIALVYAGSGVLNGCAVKKGDCMLVPQGVERVEMENTGDGAFKVARCFAPKE